MSGVPYALCKIFPVNASILARLFEDSSAYKTSRTGEYMIFASVTSQPGYSPRISPLSCCFDSLGFRTLSARPSLSFKPSVLSDTRDFG